MKHQWKPLMLVAYVFIFTGSIICMNDVLLPSLRDFFKLSYVQASFIQQSFYLVYIIFPIPIAWFISRYGYKAAIVTAMLVCGAGAALFYPSFKFSSYPLALVALFVISVGVTLVNVAANPMAALLGDPSGSHVRVNFVQLFSRIGFAITPVFATRLIYETGRGEVNFHVPYLVLGTGTLLFAGLLWLSSLPSLKPDHSGSVSSTVMSAVIRRNPQLLWGIITMFFYMGAESGTAGFFISYLKEVSGLEAAQTARYLSYYYLASTLVSVAGIYLLQIISAGKLMAAFASGMIITYMLAVFTTSWLNPYYLVALGIFISIIFPCIFSLAIEGLGSFTEKGSALVNMAVVGGAVFPPLQGALADGYGLQISYLVPCGCFIVVLLYGIYCARQSIHHISGV